MAFIAVDEAFQRKQRQKAREIRISQWWKRKLNEGICYYCGQKFSPEDLTMDHKIPVVRGGHSNKENLVTACGACNFAKKHSTAGEWLAQREDLKRSLF